MDTDVSSPTAATMTLAELAAHLAVTPQALYDLRSKGRGPRGFRVGRQLRFRLAEVGYLRDVYAPEDTRSSLTEMKPTALTGARKHRRRDRRAALKGRADGMSRRQEKHVLPVALRACTSRVGPASIGRP
ncbi:helix-turn-helix transcriptional regulator [Cellulomonas sp. NPDC055163]